MTATATTATTARYPMLHVSPIVEALRANPTVMFAVATLAQAVLWALVPALFYTAAPGDLPLTLAIGREWLPASPYGPPLASWLSEIAFRVAGSHIVGVYLLAQLCVVVTYGAVFALARRIVGAAHATIAILLMTGISAFTAPTIAFGPSVLAMPLAALSILFFYRGLTGNRRTDWLVLGITLGLLLLTTYAGLIEFALILLALVASAAGRRKLATPGPWAMIVIVALINAAQIAWLLRTGFRPDTALAALPAQITSRAIPSTAADIILWVVLTHAGLVMLALVAGRLFADRAVGAPAFERESVTPARRRFVYLFAVGPLAIAVALAALFGLSDPIGGTPPLVVLSGLAIVVAAGDTIRLYRERTAALVWLGLLVGPPAVVALATLTAPWLGIDLEVNKPAAAMADVFTDTFRRRTGRPLTIVVGDMRTAGLVAYASPDRPHLYVDGMSERAPWISEDALRRDGAIVMWPATDANGTPPAHLKARFPDMVPEVPQTFTRAMQGRLPLLRIGWAVIRPE